MINFRSLKAKSVAYTFLIMLVPIVIIGAAGTLYFYAVMKQNIQDNFLEDVRTVTDLTDNYMDRAVLYLESIADHASFARLVEYNDKQALDEQSTLIRDSTVLYDWIFITDRDGNVLTSYPYSNLTGKNLSGMQFISKPLSTASSFVSDPVHSNTSGRTSLFVAAPIIRNNTTVGALVGAIDGDNYYSLLNRSRASVPGQCIYVVNSSGDVIAHHDPGYVLTVKNLSAEPPVQYALDGKEGTIEYYDPIHGREFVGAYAPLPQYHWGVVVARPTDMAYAQVIDAIKAFILLILLLTLLSIPVALIAGNYLASPITRMAEATEQVGKGVDMSRYLPYDRKDELGNLARSFKSMSDRITAAREKILKEKKRADIYIDVMGHDINNLNQIILANLELLQQSDGRGETHDKFLEGAIQATMDSANIVRNVKAIQRILVEKPVATDIDLDNAIRQCVSEVPGPAGKKVTIQYSPGKDRIVKALPELKLAFCNVIDNSIKYSGPDVQIDISIDEKTASGKRYYVTTIADNGNGIPDEVKQNIFARFQENARSPPGKGLGLYTARMLAEIFGGSLEVENRVPGDYTKGTKVIITLPAAEGP